MIRSYFKAAWRNVQKSKMHSFINIAGLSIGMAVVIAIGLWIHDELSFDKNFKNHNRIARVLQNVTNNGEVQTWWNMPYPLADELRTNYGRDFKRVAMGANWNSHLITINDQTLQQVGGYFEKDFPEMFSLEMVEGNRNALTDPSAVLISASAAKAFFNTENALNKMIVVDQQPPQKVAGVYKDFPRNSTLFGLNFIGAWDFFFVNQQVGDNDEPWRPNFTTLFVELNENVDIAAASARIKEAKYKKVNDQLKAKKPALFLLGMDKWHLNSEFKEGKNVGGAIRYVWMFGIVGIFVLMLACINFMNLSTARSEKRAKEVGIRKTLGSMKKQLLMQFFTESFLTVFLAFLFSLVLARAVLPLFNSLADKQMDIPWTSWIFWVTAVGFIILTAGIAGSYPAFYLSSFKPIKVLKGTFKAGPAAAIPRKVLVVFQFTVSVALVIGTMVVYRQIQFAKDRPIGYSRENLVNVPLMNSALHDHVDQLRNELLKTGLVESIAESESPTTDIWNSSSGFSWPGKDPGLSTDFGVVVASYDFGKTIGWNVKEGRDFSREYGLDTAAVLLNEAAARYMNLKNPVGQTITQWDDKLTVIGVVQDMVVLSPYAEAKPTVYRLSRDQGSLLLLKLKATANAHEAMSKIEPIFKRINPEQPFDFKFVDDDYNQKFITEGRVGKLANLFALLAIIISCLGLFGLTSFVAEQRKKEIGVRKVLGASVFNVWNLMSREFMILVAISFIIAMPLAYYFMNSWLQNYNYRTNISWMIFAGAGLGCLLITIVVVSLQTIKAALTNPVQNLRSE